jgi:hypothetical protein
MAHHTKIGSFLYIKWILPPVLQRAAQTFERQAQQSLSVGGAPHKKVWAVNAQSSAQIYQPISATMPFPLSIVLPTNLFCPKCLKGKHEKGDLDEGHLQIVTN